MLKVLVIDDSQSVHAFLRRILRGSPRVLLSEAYSGAEVLKFLSREEKFDAILLDWEMPALNGLETLAAIKKENSLSRVIMMTTKNAPSDIVQMLALGASEYVMKPFTLDILISKIDSVLSAGGDHVE